MKKYPFPLISLVVGFGLMLAVDLVAAGEPAAPSASKAVTSTQFIPASDARFRYEGRCDFADPAAPGIVWQGTRIGLEFEGGRLVLRFAGAMGQNFFDVSIDGAKQIVAVPEGAAQQIDVSPAFAPGRHQLVLFKRNEAASGTVRFAGVEIAADAKVQAPRAPDYKLRMEFIGDSITAGACNEDGDTDQWENRRTHNHALSYSTLTAEAFAADYRCAAVSGMGVVIGWAEPKAGQIWDRLYPRVDSPRADVQSWQPDVAFVNLGENDASFTGAHGQPFPAAAFTDGYVALVQAMRAAYPKAHLVLLRGGMFNGAQNPELRRAWEVAVARLETADPAVSHFAFTHWSKNHPRVSDDRAMADELIAWLRSQSFIAQPH